jgi:hypothetical protein
MVNAAMGAQAFGAAQAYTLKQFERSLFQIATGDSEDADFNEQTNLPRHSSAPRETGNSKPQPGDLGATDFKAALRTFDYLRVSILQAMRGKELTPREANDRYNEIRQGSITYAVNGKDKSVNTDALLKQCTRSDIWRDNPKSDFMGFELRLKETREELDREISSAGETEEDPFYSPHEAMQ